MEVGESMKRLAEVKDSLDIDVKQNFIDPLQGLCDKDLREIQVCFPFVLDPSKANLKRFFVHPLKSQFHSSYCDYGSKRGSF